MNPFDPNANLPANGIKEIESPLTPPPTPPDVYVGPRFCTTCGIPWQPGQLECPDCAVRAARAAAAAVGAPPHTHAAHAARNPLVSPIALYFAFLAAAVVGIIAGVAGAQPVRIELTLSVVITAIVLLWCLGSLRDVFTALTVRFNPVWLAIAAGASVLTFVIATGALAALNRILGVPLLRATDELAAAGYALPFMILIIAIQPAIIEELAFRGIMFSRLQTVLSPIETLFVSALMFMIIHLAVPSFPHLLILGLALGWLRLHTGSLYPCMVLHFGHNLLCVLTEHWRIGLP